MTVISSQPTHGAGILAYHNLLVETGGTVTASTETSGYPKENAYDWRPFTWWKPTTTGDSYIEVDFASAKTCDYFAVAFHNIGSQSGSAKLQYWTGSAWEDATTASAGTNDRVIFISFTSISALKYRLLVTGQPNIGMVAFGNRLDLPRGFPSGFIPGPLGRNNEYKTSVSEGGQFLGRSISRKTYTTSINMPNIEPGWVRNYWEGFIDHAELKPFFFSWDQSSHSDEAVIAWIGNSYTPPQYDTETTMAVSLTMDCRR